MFERAEILLRRMLRWALKGIAIDTRCCLLYLVSNSTTLQVLSQKFCVRFFKSVQDHPRFITQFISSFKSEIEPELLGRSTLLWWDEVRSCHSSLTNTKPLYSAFRKAIVSEIRASARVATTGLTQVLASVV